MGTLARADREQPARWTSKGLILPGKRKRIQPMAARVQPDNVRSAHQSMHHRVANAGWSDQALLSSVAEYALPQLIDGDETVHWVMDHTGLPKNDTHSVGEVRFRVEHVFG